MLMLRTALRRRGGDAASLAPGDIVMLQADGTPRAFWQLGRIEEVLPSRDNVARVFRVHLGGGKFVNRAGKTLAKLL